MRHAANTALFDHWASIRRGRRTPDRRDIDPVAIRHVLSHTFMLEVDSGRPAERAYPVRVSGTRLDALFGRSVKDEGFLDLWRADHGVELRILIEAVLDEALPAAVGGLAAPMSYPPTAVEMLMLPLRCQGRTHSRLLCSLVPVTTPAWLGLAGVEPLGLTTWRMINATDARLRATPDLSASPARRFTVIEGGRSADAPASMPATQHRVKAVVQGSVNAPLSTRNP